jgi:hypothetical protein
VGAAHGERRLHAPGEPISTNLLGGGEHDEVHQISDARVLLGTGQRVGVQLLGEVLDHRIDRELDRGDPGELEQVRAAEQVGRLDERVPTRHIDVKRREFQPGYAGSDTDAQRPTRRGLHLLGHLAELEREVVCAWSPDASST